MAKSQIDNLQLDMFGTNAGLNLNEAVLPITATVQLPLGGNGRSGPLADSSILTFTPVTSLIDTVRTVDLSILNSGVIAEIKDAGEELTYNRRNRIKAAKRWVDIADLNDTLKAKEAVKANVWPKPDYKKLIEDGMQPMVAHIVKQVYDSVAIKPVISGGTLLNDVSLQLYISAINRVETGVLQWAQDPIALQQWAEANARVAGAMLGKPIAISSLVGEAKGLQDIVYPEGWKHYREELIIVGGNKLLGALQPRYDEINRAMKAIAKGWPEKREAWEVQGFRVLDNPEIEVHKSPYNKDKYLLGVDNKFIKSFDSMEEAGVAAAAIKPFVLFGKRGMLNSFASEEDAVTAAKELSGRDKGNSVGEKGIRVEAAERIGIHRRMEGENITSERLAEEFGFKGVNFGNWLKTPSARAEAQLHLNHAFDSAHDLADILEIPPKAISLNGMLGLAIGAQGGGGNAAAHFVPGVNEINLTRTSGTGSLAHEWAHAMDHYFAAQGGLATSSEPFLTEHARLNSLRTVGNMIDGKWVTSQVPRFGDLRPEVVTAFNTIVKSMNERTETEDEAKAGRIDHLANAKSSLGKWLDALRRDFVGQEVEFDQLAGRARVGDFGDGQLVIGRNTYIAPVVGAIRDLYKEKHGRVYSIDKSKGLQSSIDSFSYWSTKAVTEEDHVPQMVATSYAKNARALDREKRGKPYWSTTLEKFARAFDAFVSDELLAREAKNSYLSHSGRLDETVPTGGERDTINSAFRALIGEVKTRETEKGIALFSRGAGNKLVGNIHSIASATASMLDAHVGKDKVALQALIDGGKVQVITAEQGRHIVGDKLFMTAWHGSPHDHDGFSLEHIGTGEGNQAYGYGLYFAGNKEVAEHYRKALTIQNSDALQNHAKEQGLSPELADVLGQYYATSVNATFDDFAKSSLEKSPSEYIELFRNKWIRTAIHDGSAKAAWDSFKQAGKLYQVDLKPSEDKYLLWDKPLSEQSDHVKAILRELDLVHPDLLEFNPARVSGTTGEDFYNNFSEKTNKFDDRQSSADLHSLGILGIKYLDGSSRDMNGINWKEGIDGSQYDRLAKGVAENYLKGRGDVQDAIGRLKRDALASGVQQYTDAAKALESGDLVLDLNYNFVIFDDRDVEITAKYSRDFEYDNKGRALAFFSQTDGNTYFVADHLPLDYDKNEWRGLVRHEVGVHALRLGKGDAEFQEILTSLGEMHDAGDVDVVNAFARVPKNTPAAYVSEEALAYLIQNNSGLSIVDRAMAWFRKAVRSLGDAMPLLKKTAVYEWADALSKDDLLYMAQSAMADSLEANYQREFVHGSDMSGVMFSRPVVVIEGSFSGKVLDVTDSVVTQKIGRDPNEVVRHDVARLSAGVKIGDVVDIKYRGGVGMVTGKAVVVER